MNYLLININMLIELEGGYSARMIESRQTKTNQSTFPFVSNHSYYNIKKRCYLVCSLAYTFIVVVQHYLKRKGKKKGGEEGKKKISKKRIPLVTTVSVKSVCVTTFT